MPLRGPARGSGLWVQVAREGPEARSLVWGRWAGLGWGGARPPRERGQWKLGVLQNGGLAGGAKGSRSPDLGLALGNWALLWGAALRGGA